MKQLTLNIIDRSFQIGISKEDKKRFSVTVGGNTYEGTIEDESESHILVAVEGVLYNIEIPKEQDQGEFRASVNSRERIVATGISSGKRSMEVIRKPAVEPQPETKEEPKTPTAGISGGITAPMPGKVVKVNVNVGDAINTGDVILILEAMKMENEICANISGTVKEIHVAAGDSVDSNDVLIVIG